MQDYLESWSDLKGSANYKPLTASMDLSGKSLLIERHRDRGIGDHLFMTGIIRWLQSRVESKIQIYWHAPLDRSSLLIGNKDLNGDAPLCGPINYDSLPRYGAHWLVETATEYNEENDQLNVYDALLAQIGADYTTIPAAFKRPYITLSPHDYAEFAAMRRHLRDLERAPALLDYKYAVFAPTARSSLRSPLYSTMLAAVAETARQLPVVVVGDNDPERIPATDMTVAEFSDALDRLASQGLPVVSLFGRTKLRPVAAMMSKAAFVVTLDTGTLYMAQGVGTPVVSLWGTHHPRTRIGYDTQAMDLAIFKSECCPQAPCYAYRDFPANRCPKGVNQMVCQPIESITVDDIMSKINLAAKIRQ